MWACHHLRNGSKGRSASLSSHHPNSCSAWCNSHSNMSFSGSRSGFGRRLPWCGAAKQGPRSAATPTRCEAPGHTHQQQPHHRVARAGPRSPLVHLPVARLSGEPLSLRLSDPGRARWLDPPEGVHQGLLPVPVPLCRGGHRRPRGRARARRRCRSRSRGLAGTRATARRRAAVPRRY